MQHTTDVKVNAANEVLEESEIVNNKKVSVNNIKSNQNINNSNVTTSKVDPNMIVESVHNEVKDKPLVP